MTSENNAEMTDKKAELCEANLNADTKPKYVFKKISDVRWFDPVKQEWIDMGYEGPISFNCREEYE